MRTRPDLKAIRELWCDFCGQSLGCFIEPCDDQSLYFCRACVEDHQFNKVSRLPSAADLDKVAVDIQTAENTAGR